MKILKMAITWLIIYFFYLPTSVNAMTSLNVAVLPVINTANYRYAEDIKVIKNTIKEPFKYPYYSVIPDGAVDSAIRATATDNKAVSLSAEQTMAELAGKLSADLVIVIELSEAKIFQFSNFCLEDTYIESGIVLKCYTYSALNKKYNVIKVTQFKIEPATSNTSGEVYFKELTDEILAKLPYKRIPASK